jgi:hypothetical protein
MKRQCLVSYHRAVRALLLVAIAGCATSADLGVIQSGIGDGMGGSLSGHAGFGGMNRKALAVDISARADIAENNSRLAFGGSVLGGLPIGSFRVLGRIGLWRAATSSTSERAVVPTFELAGYIPLREDPIVPGDKHGWFANGVIIGVREDLDVAAYTTIFVGFQAFLIPGY